MSHLNQTVFDDQRLLELAKRGCYLEYDLFGVECSHYQVAQGAVQYVSVYFVILLLISTYTSQKLYWYLIAEKSLGQATTSCFYIH